MNLREKLVRQYLPLWAKETVLWENKRLKHRNEELEQRVRELTFYIKGMRDGKQPLIVEQKQEDKEDT